MVVGSEWNSPVAVGCVRQVVHSPWAGCGINWPSGLTEFVQRSLGHQVAIPWWVRYILEHCTGKLWWDLLVLGYLCWLAVGVALRGLVQEMPLGRLGPPTEAAGAGGRMSWQEVEGLKVGAVILVPGRTRSSRDLRAREEKKELWCDAKYCLLSHEVQL